MRSCERTLVEKVPEARLHSPLPVTLTLARIDCNAGLRVEDEARLGNLAELGADPERKVILLDSYAATRPDTGSTSGTGRPQTRS